VTAETSQGPQIIGGSADVTVKASYFAGGGLGGAEVNWYVTASETTFTPPNRDDFTFGVWTPWWETRFDGERRVERLVPTDSAGKHHLKMDFWPWTRRAPPACRPKPPSWTSTARPGRRPRACSCPCCRLRRAQERSAVRPAGEALRVQAIVTDLDGKAVTGQPVSLRAERLGGAEGRRVEGSPVDGQDCALRSAETGSAASRRRKADLTA
jgi:hypothetical protein